VKVKPHWFIWLFILFCFLWLIWWYSLVHMNINNVFYDFCRVEYQYNFLWLLWLFYVAQGCVRAVAFHCCRVAAAPWFKSRTWTPCHNSSSSTPDQPQSLCVRPSSHVFLQDVASSCQNLELIGGARRTDVCLEILLVFIFAVWNLLVHFVIYFKITVYECKIHIYMVGLAGLYDCQWWSWRVFGSNSIWILVSMIPLVGLYAMWKYT
jgi:hypothetical protein